MLKHFIALASFVFRFGYCDEWNLNYPRATSF
jgi:hypothetical protein